ncbi:hypothetical protein J2W17_002515 [Pseudomonas lini]|uniref:DUF2934 domain-containing protein n=1 Tax=Pseudomonas lini TaxID=163011 RepID=UPI002780BF2D|nr:DUF2934 domain-containing protein [Pseudomonas lini]MDQ0123568.1 hypothetical protein [Pseudomonas lini]
MIDESKIRQRAYELWERDARSDGAAEYYWRLAQEQLEKEGQPSAAGSFEPASGGWESGSDELKQQAEGGEKADEDEWPAKGEAARYSGA